VIDFRVESELVADETRVVSVAGELDMYTATSFERPILEALESGAARVVVDLSECKFLDSTALGILISARRQLGEQDDRLVLVVADPNIFRIFEITGLESTFTIVPTRAAAVNGAARF
jgi:anti-sigma B factor antagonist